MRNLSEKIVAEKDENNEWHLKATCDITAGDLLLEEQPLFLTPDWENELMKCSNCFQQSLVMCKKCSFFPICLDCPTHNEFDCTFFQSDEVVGKISNNFLVNNYTIFGTLKFLLLLENPATCQNYIELLAKDINLDDFRENEMFQQHQTKIVTPLLESGLLSAFKNVKIDADLLHKLIILLEINSFEIKKKNNDNLRGIYIFGRKLQHNCVPNTIVTINEKFTMKIYASVAIKNGEIIYHTFTNPLMGTRQRQHHLRMTKHLECTCKRCLDPTELDTHMSSLKCKQCADGFAVCDLNKTENWICMSCNAVIEAALVHTLIGEIGEEIIHADGDIRIYEHILAKYHSLFHKNHFLIIDIKQNIITILSAILTDFMCKPGKLVFQRKLQLCEEVLPVMRAVIPGISKLYAIALYEYLYPYKELAYLEYESQDITKDVYIQKLQRALEMAKTAVEMLHFEPMDSQEGIIAMSIETEIENTESFLKKFIEN